jgi:hypothetical protein
LQEKIVALELMGSVFIYKKNTILLRMWWVQEWRFAGTRVLEESLSPSQFDYYPQDCV